MEENKTIKPEEIFDKDKIEVQDKEVKPEIEDKEVKPEIQDNENEIETVMTDVETDELEELEEI